ncbi:MAG TPA: type IV toxin-antitoxin system AbiEi family antitoxin domain-containing protein [Bacillota bacterium]|nr:type IV toxin-antitoxin system AbiEi family antitoxin domain-containing protein [Bacillota bacterium]
MKTLTEYFAKNSLITNRDAENIGIGRHILSDLAAQGKLERIRPGVYQRAGEIVDDFVLISSNSERIVFSHQTALYLYGLSDRSPGIFYISVPQGYNASHIKKRYDNLQVRYVKKDLYPIGIRKMTTPLGNTVQAYDLERTICDIIIDRGKIDTQIFTDGLKRYFRGNEKDLRTLIKYSRRFNIEDRVRRYMEVLHG